MNYFAIPGVVSYTIRSINRPRGRALKHTPEALNERVLNTCLEYYDVKIAQLATKSRKETIVRMRQVCMYILCKYTGSQMDLIAKMFKRDRTTVVHSRETVDKELSSPIENWYKSDIEAIEYHLSQIKKTYETI